MTPIQMTPLERRAALSLASIFATRMLGLFMILPVFALYAEELPDVTPLLIGVAIGIYGFTQALLQIPFGMLSDRLGRKPVIAGGLLIFAIGSAVAALSTTIEGIILGRALQGAGAIAAAVMALVADLTQEEHRTKAMAIIGATIGFSFLAAMVAGPIVNSWVGVPGIFWLTAALAVLGILVLFTAVPHPDHLSFHRDTEVEPSRFHEVLGDSQLLRLDMGIFTLHMILTASFVVLPLVLRDSGFAPVSHWKLYLPVMVLAMVAMVPFIIIAEKKRRMKQILVGAIALLVVAELLLIPLHGSLMATALLMWLFFTAFNLLEASLPSLVAKTAPGQNKGTAMGVYSSSQFIGAFIGGLAGGWLYGQAGAGAVFAFCAVVLSVWLVAAITMREPRYLATTLINVGQVGGIKARQLELDIAKVNGVKEVSINLEEGVAYLKVESEVLDEDELERFSTNPP